MIYTLTYSFTTLQGGAAYGIVMIPSADHSQAVIDANYQAARNATGQPNNLYSGYNGVSFAATPFRIL